MATPAAGTLLAALYVLHEELREREAILKRSVAWHQSRERRDRASAPGADRRPPPQLLRDEGGLDQLRDILPKLGGILQRFEESYEIESGRHGHEGLEVPPEVPDTAKVYPFVPRWLV